jgi:transposase
MLTPQDYAEACRRYKQKKGNGHERQRYHALILVTKGYTYRETAEILLVDEDTVSQWVKRYRAAGLAGLQNHPEWGGNNGQRWLSEVELAELKEYLETQAMPGTKLGSGWTAKAIRAVIAERYEVAYGRSGLHKVLQALGWSYQRGRKLYAQRSAAEQARYELETQEALAECAASGERVIPLAGDQSKIYLEGSIAKRWNPVGQQPLIPDGARSKAAENIYGALPLGTGEEVATLVVDWQDSTVTICWLELILETFPRGLILLWLDQAPHHTSGEVEEWLAAHPRLRVIHFPAYTPEENPKEQTWKYLKEEVSHHHWHDSLAELGQEIDQYYQTARYHTVNFLKKFGYEWVKGFLYPLPEPLPVPA